MSTKIFDDNLENLLSESNKKGYDQITDLFVYDIKLGYGNRVYDLVIRAAVDEKPEGRYFTNDDVIKYNIMRMIKTKFGIKCGVDIQPTILT